MTATDRLVGGPELWRAKVAAWIHDPAEKALVLLRDPAGHEGGTTAALKTRLFGSGGVPAALDALVRTADRCAAAADRPQFPREAGSDRFAAWTQVRFADEPELIHPLSGTVLRIRETLRDLDPAALKAVSLDHWSDLIVEQDGQIDWRLTYLNFWRFGAEAPARDIGALWECLPADTRVPGHTIWDHLGLTAALAGTLTRGPSAALLAVSFGPVQSFIAQARTTSDLWAGSHLLSHICWEGMKVVCEQLGPDAILFPSLRGVAAVDLWLQQQGLAISEERARRLAWKRMESDANPLFSAALPNRFLAIVPAADAERLASEVTAATRAWVLRQGESAWRTLAREADTRTGESDTLPDHVQAQLAAQLGEFPEVHWSSAPWELSGEAGSASSAAAPLRELAEAYFAGEAWRCLEKGVELDGAQFYQPNSGVLYGAAFAVADRMAAAAKALRPFSGLKQQGYRCTLCGEREWLCQTPELLHAPRQQRGAQGEDFWCRLHGKAAVREDEFLCALCALKRVWPRLFQEELKTSAVGLDTHRHVVSTHTMALASSMTQLLKQVSQDRPGVLGKLRRLQKAIGTGSGSAVLPRKLLDQCRSLGSDSDLAEGVCRGLPARLDELSEGPDEPETLDELRNLRRTTGEVLGARPEAYYALLKLDGDRMGAWLSGTTQGHSQGRQLRDFWHSSVRGEVERRFGTNKALATYLDAPPPASPARHVAISQALNNFSSQLARLIVEDCFCGRVLYSGGDDLLAMIGLADLPACMLLLRCVYAGQFPADSASAWSFLGVASPKLEIGRGHVRTLVGTRSLLRVMGETATASIGAVVAHHMTPLAATLRELNTAEHRAKTGRSDGADRDGFSISVMKRSGGAVRFTAGWRLAGDSPQADFDLAATPMGLLMRLVRFYSAGLSRKAAYLISDWAARLPDPGSVPAADWERMVQLTLAWQLRRQGEAGGACGQELDGLAAALGRFAALQKERPQQTLTDLFAVSEFLGREGRVATSGPSRAEIAVNRAVPAAETVAVEERES